MRPLPWPIGGVTALLFYEIYRWMWTVRLAFDVSGGKGGMGWTPCYHARCMETGI